ncbi:MAG: hypothetical protein ACI4I5_08680 [Acutalibacteraceae bacterium]
MYRKSPTRICVELLILFTAFFLLEKILMPINSFGVLTCAVGLAALVGLSLYSSRTAKKLGLATRGHDLLVNFFRAAWICAGSIAVVLLAEEAVFLLKGNRGLFFNPTFEIGYSTAAASSVEKAGIKTFLVWAGVGIVISLVRALFFEIAFRGYCLSLNASETYASGNKRQAIYFTIMASAPTVYGVVQGMVNEPAQHRSIAVAVLAILASWLNLYLLAYRHGKLRYATGSVWVCIFSYWAFDYFNSMFKAFQTLPEPLTYYALIFRSLMVQIVAFVLTEIYLRSVRKKMINHSEFDDPKQKSKL